MTKLGFIGLGVMGNSMVKHLLNAGNEVIVYTRTPSKADEVLSLGAIWANNPAEVAQKADIVFTIVGYPHDVREVYVGQDGLFSHGRSGQIFVDMTTSTPSLARELSHLGQEKGIAVLDAPVSGGDLGAREGRLTTMVGGDAVAFERVRPYFDTFSAKVKLQGESGAGQHTKMANQIMIAGTMLGMCECLAYANEAGLELEDVLETVGAGSAGNWSLANYAPRILREDYSPGFFAKHFLKDLGIALEEAAQLEVPLPMTELAHVLYTKLCDAGHENDGTQSLIKLWWKN